jgi:hypothetical protein
VTADQLSHAQQLVEIVTVQNYYNLASRILSAATDGKERNSWLS